MCIAISLVGIVFHSVIIGLALGVATGEWNTLIIALSFHQLFEVCVRYVDDSLLRLPRFGVYFYLPEAKQ